MGYGGSKENAWQIDSILCIIFLLKTKGHNMIEHVIMLIPFHTKGAFLCKIITHKITKTTTRVYCNSQ